MWTNFPNGISVTTATGSVAGQINCNKITALEQSVIGEVACITHSFTTGSASQEMCVAVPFNGNLVACYVTVDTVSAIQAAYTVRQGSAGTVSVSSENNVKGVDYSISSLTIDSAALTTASGIRLTRGVQGTAGASTITLVVARSA